MIIETIRSNTDEGGRQWVCISNIPRKTYGGEKGKGEEERKDSKIQRWLGGAVGFC